VQRGRKNPQIETAKTYSLREGIFTTAVVTPELADEAALTDVLRRVKMEAGKLERASILLPDAWFRMNLIELPSIPERGDEALHAIRWSLKRTLPIPPESLRMGWEVLGKSSVGLKVLVISAVEKTLAAIERGRCLWIASSTCSRSKRGMSTIAVPVATETPMITVRPYTWKNGMIARIRSPFPTAACHALHW